MAVGTLTSDQAAMMLEKVKADVLLPNRVRNNARRMSASVPQPARVLRRLQTLASQELPLLPTVTPTAALLRVVSAAAFWEFLSRPEVRDAFTTADDFLRYVDSSDSPTDVLWSFLSADPVLFDWTRSWLAESAPLRGLSGRQLAQALELTQDPPFVVFHLSLSDLRREGVAVRAPCSLDSVLGPNPHWRPGGPVSGVREFVDGNVPRAAVSSIEWVSR